MLCKHEVAGSIPVTSTKSSSVIDYRHFTSSSLINKQNSARICILILPLSYPAVLAYWRCLLGRGVTMVAVRIWSAS